MKWPAWAYRLVPYLGRRQADEDLQEELRLHLEMERERQRDAGVPEADARRAARRRLGNGTLIRERTRDVWGWRWLDDLGRDMRHALRGLGRSPGFAAAVVLVLALGIGANTAMFGIVHGMLLRPLPYPEADAIVRVGHVSAASWPAQVVVSNLTLPRLQEEAESFEQLAAYVPRSPTWSGPEGPRTLQGAMVSPALFPLLRTAPHLGRLFVEEDARDGADRVALLSHGAWSNRYGADPGVIGVSLDLDGEASTVVGVLPAGFSFPSPAVEVWTPLVVPAFEPGALGLNFPALGRLRPGVAPERAAAEADTILNADRSPSDPRPRLEARVIPLQEEMVRGLRPALVLLSAVTALVLVIACINVAGLFLAHGVARRRELAVRGALGAGRGRIVRQLLTESVVLGVAGGMLGLAAAALILHAAPALAFGDLPRLEEVGVDGTVLAFVAGLSVVAGLVLGAVPALSWSRLHLVRALGESSPRAAGGFRILSANRIRAALAVTQVGLALVLLVGAGLLLRGFVRLVSVDPGYDAGSVLTATVNHPDLGRLILAGEFDAVALSRAWTVPAARGSPSSTNRWSASSSTANRRSADGCRAGELSHRRRDRRPPDVHRGGAGADRRGARRLLAPGAPRDTDRSLGNAAVGVAPSSASSTSAATSTLAVVSRGPVAGTNSVAAWVRFRFSRWRARRRPSASSAASSDVPKGSSITNR